MTTLTGLVRLVRFILRRDRLRLALWVFGTVGLVLISAASLPSVYNTEVAISSYVTTAGDNPAMVAFAGPGHGFDEPEIGVILVNEVQVFAMILVALMSIFLVNRNTRAEEDTDQAELIRSSVVGRHAPVAAAVLVIGAANVVVGVLCFGGFVSLDYPVVGSAALAGSITAVGLVFVGIAAVVAQVMSSGRATLGVSTAVLGGSFAVRALGDIADNGLSWLSPLGWAQAVRPFAGEAMWTLALCVLVSLVLVLGAFQLSMRRDLGSGLVPQRPGRATAKAWMRSPLGLAVRLQRGSVVGWCAGMFFLGGIYGAVADDVEAMVQDNPALAEFMAQMGGASVVDAFLATAVTMLVTIAAGFTISAVLQLRTEEKAGSAEVLLSTPTSRWSWTGSHLVVAAVGSVLVVVAASLGMGIAYALVTSDASQVLRLLGAGLATLPALFVLLGIAIALAGLAPRFSNAAWAALVAVFVLGYLGELLRVPQWARALSPLDHVPALPAETFAAMPLVALTVVAACLVGVGLVGWRRRDLHPW